jgi:hypothetical protein
MSSPQIIKEARMLKDDRGIGRAARLGLVALALGLAASSPAVPASAATDNFGHAVYQCARAMLPYDIDSRGAITMKMPDGSTMQWRNFGEMVTFMSTYRMC